MCVLIFHVLSSVVPRISLLARNNVCMTFELSTKMRGFVLNSKVMRMLLRTRRESLGTGYVLSATVVSLLDSYSEGFLHDSIDAACKTPVTT